MQTEQIQKREETYYTVQNNSEYSYAKASKNFQLLALRKSHLLNAWRILLAADDNRDCFLGE